MSALPPGISILDRATELIGRAIRWLALAMVAITLLIVLLRYAFNIGAIPLQESVMYMHGTLFLLGIPYGLRQGTHVRVDILYSKMPPAGQNLIDLAGHVLFLLPVSVFILYTSLPYAQASWRVFEGSSEVGGLPAIFLLKTLIPLTAVLLLSQACVEITRCVQRLRGQP